MRAMSPVVDQLRQWLFGTSPGQLIDDIARRAIPAVLQRVETLASTMDAMEAKGYVRARARVIVQRECANIPASQWPQGLLSSRERLLGLALERVVQATVHQITHRRQPTGHVGNRRAA